ncbi:hypothetical protein SHD_0618, partial [Shewanella decolorationis S12]
AIFYGKAISNDGFFVCGI